MSYASREILRAFNAAAVEEIGLKKTMKILRKALDLLSRNLPANDGGPEIGARVDAVQVVRSALRICMVERSKRRQG